MVFGHAKRTRDDHDQRASGGGQHHTHGSGWQNQARAYHSRHQRHDQYAQVQMEPADQDLDSQIQHLQATLSARLSNIRSRETTSHKDYQLLQDRMEVLGEREQQVLDRELAVSKREGQLETQQAIFRQLQLDLLQQYNAVVAELPRVEDRLQAARQLLPDGTKAAASCVTDSPPAEPAASVAAVLLPHLSASPSESQPGLLAEAKAWLRSDLSTANATPTETDQAPTCCQNSAACPIDSPVTGADQHHHHTPSKANPVGDPPVSLPSPEGPTSAAAPEAAMFLPEGQLQSQHVSAQLQEAAPASGCQIDMLQHAQQSNPGQQAPCGAAAPSSAQPASPMLPVCDDGTSVGKQKAATELPAVAFVTPVQSRPVTRQQIARQAPGRDSHSQHVQRHTLATDPGRLVSQTHSTSNAPGSDRPVLPPLRMGLRSSSDAAANADSSDVVDKSMAQEVMSPSSSRTAGRGRGLGRASRRGRGRSNLHRTTYPQPAGDLDEAVQALKATTESAELLSTQADSKGNGGIILADDDLKPSFMRRMAADSSSAGMAVPAEGRLRSNPSAKEKPSDDINPRPIARRRTDPNSSARQAVAKAVLQKEVPELLELLQQKGLADQMDLLEHAQDTLTSKQDSLYGSVHNILARVCKANSWQGRIAGLRSNGAEGEEGGKHEYCLLALEHLLERAEAYRAAAQPVRWGWCRELSSFVFVLENANRIAVEKPCYGHATYFFDLEEPLSVSEQVQRLIAILSVPGVSRRKLLEGCSLDPGPDLTQQERKQLEAAGWKPGATIRTLLNFTGDRIRHQSAEVMTGQKPAAQNVSDYKDKIAKVLSDGARGGRVRKT